MPSTAFRLEIRRKIDATGVRVFFVPGKIMSWWNKQRENPEEEPRAFCGWFWTLHGEEGGPYKTASEAQRQFYYAKILNRAAPTMSLRDLAQAQKGIERAAEKSRPRLRRVA